MKQLLRNTEVIDFEALGYHTRLTCEDAERARNICGLHLHAYAENLQPELSRLHTEIANNKTHAAALHYHLYSGPTPINDAAMLTHSCKCRIVSILVVLAGIASFAGNLLTWHLFGVGPFLTILIAVAGTALPIVIGHLAYEKIVMHHRWLQTAVIGLAALLCILGGIRLAQARLMMIERTAEAPPQTSYVDGAADPQPNEETVRAEKAAEQAEARIRHMRGEAVLMMMLAAELMLGYLVGELTKHHTDEDYRAWRTLKAVNAHVTTLEENASRITSSLEIAKRHCMAGILRAENVRTKPRVPYYRELAVFILFAFVAANGAHAQTIDRYEGILIDTSGSISQNGTTSELFREYLLGTRKLLLTEPPKSRVWISTIAVDSFGGVRELLKGWTPDAQGVFTNDLTRARRELAAAFESKSAALSPTARSTDIIGGLWHLKTLFESDLRAGQTAKAIWIFSDMMNETDKLPMPALMGLGPEQMMEHVKANGLLVPLNGYKVYVYGASPSGLSPQAWETVKKFWSLYFSAAGAELVSYSAECSVER